jgi:hypothetical protein
MEIFQHSGNGIPLFMNGHKNRLQAGTVVGTGPSSYKRRIYRAAVSQRLRNTGLEDVRVSSFPGHLSPVVKKITDLPLLPWILISWLRGARTGSRYKLYA